MVQRIYIDTEFTDLIDIDLISIALVAGKEHLYLERSDYDDSLCSSFTRSEVLPHLGKVSAMPWDEMAKAVSAWLKQYEQQQPIICFDNGVDYALLLELLGSWPEGMGTANIRNKLNPTKLENYYLYNYAVRHHALHDALANQYAHEI